MRIRHLGSQTSADAFAVAQNGEAVAHGPDFFEKVGDIDNRKPLAFEPTNEIEQLFDIAAREAAGRFIEHKHPAADRDGPGHFNQLLLGNRQTSGPKIERNVRTPDSGQPGRRFLAKFGAFDERPCRWFHAQENIFGDRQVRRERKLLINHRHTPAPGVERASRCIRLTVELHLPGVGMMRPGEDFHERAFPRSIFTDQPENLAGADVQVHAIECDRGAKRLAHALHLKTRAHGRVRGFNGRNRGSGRHGPHGESQEEQQFAGRYHPP